MFNRSANLSGRRPLLDEPLARLPTIHPNNNGFYQHTTCRQAPQYLPEVKIQRQPTYWKPSNVELEKRLQETRAREKVGYFHNKIILPEHSLDRREAELVFRFDPSAEYQTNQYQVPSVQYSRYGQQGNGLSPPRVPDKNGPFVFGVHDPSHFQRRQEELDYDYSEVPDENGQTVVIRDSGSDGANCCDKVNEWTARDKTKKKLNRFEINVKKKVNVRKEKIKCVLVGDGAVGKTSLITAYAQDKFREEYQPTAFDTFNVVVDVDDRPVSVEICDTAGQDSMKELRELCYPGTDVLMLCFSLVKPETFKSVADRWTKAARAVGAPVILVGTQSDLAQDVRVLENLRIRGEHVVTEAEAKALAMKINAVYMETSAKTRTKLKDAFDSAILAALPVMKKKKPIWKKLCCVN